MSVTSSGGLVREVVPLVARVVAHAVRAALALGVDEAHGDEVGVRVERAPVGHRERVVRDGVRDRPPDVDQAHAALQEAVRVGGEVVAHARDGGGVRLVDVHEFLWGGVSALPGWSAHYIGWEMRTAGPRIWFSRVPSPASSGLRRLCMCMCVRGQRPPSGRTYVRVAIHA